MIELIDTIADTIFYLSVWLFIFASFFCMITYGFAWALLKDVGEDDDWPKTVDEMWVYVIKRMWQDVVEVISKPKKTFQIIVKWLGKQIKGCGK